MATSGGHLLVPKALRMIKIAVEKTSQYIRDKIPQAARTIEAEIQPVHAKIQVRQPINRVAAIKQQQSRWFSTRKAIKASIRQFSSVSKHGPTPIRSSYPTSRTAQAVSRLTSRAPFASTLRPNLTGGTLSRSAGGYGTGAGRVGGARYFSHSPAAPAQVINNVSQAVRAFWLSGQKAQFDGFEPVSGGRRYRAVSALQEEAGRKMRASRVSMAGSYLDFKVTPTITAIGPLSSVSRTKLPVQSEDCLNQEGLMDLISVDFARALKDLAAIMNDLKKLSTLGDLPISLPNSSTLRVRFPGCDADTVERLCQELGIRRGLVYQDSDFDLKNGTEMALLFPFASSKTPSEINYSSEARSPKRQKRDHFELHEMLSENHEAPPIDLNGSVTSDGFEEVEHAVVNPWASSPSGYSSLHESDEGDVAMYFEQSRAKSGHETSEFEGLEGIYRFLEECDRARR